jgi:hypothetical protein
MKSICGKHKRASKRGCAAADAKEENLRKGPSSRLMTVNITPIKIAFTVKKEQEEANAACRTHAKIKLFKEIIGRNNKLLYSAQG